MTNISPAAAGEIFLCLDRMDYVPSIYIGQKHQKFHAQIVEGRGALSDNIGGNYGKGAKGNESLCCAPTDL